MDISNLIDSALKIDCLERDRLFYNQYQWCMDFRLANARALQVQAKTLEKYLDRVKGQWQYRTASFISGMRRRYLPNLGGSWKPSVDHDLESSQLDVLIGLAEILWQNKHDVKPVFYWDWIYLYTNDLGLISELKERANISITVVKQAQVTRARDTIYRQNSVYSMRTYFRERALTASQKQGLSNFLTAQPDIRLSPSLKYWLENIKWNRSRGYYWFDHNDRGTSLMLEMMAPGLIGNTQQIISINTQSETED